MTTPGKRLLLNAVAFEQWLRFAWLDDECRISVPAVVRDRLRLRHPELMPILDALDGRVIDDGTASVAAIAAAVRPLIGDDAFSSVRDDPDFRETVQSFHRWVQDEDEHPTVDKNDFAEWLAAFLAADARGPHEARADIH